MSNEIGWEYADANTQQITHGIHPYPARMIPQIANRIILGWSGENNTILDPFCGSGSVLVESLLTNRNAIGVDINPLAYLLAKVKTTRISEQELSQKMQPYLEEINDKIIAYRSKQLSVKTFVFKNIFHWFKKSVVDELTIIRDVISKEKNQNQNIYDLLSIIFSNTIRKASNIDFDDNPYFIRIKKGEKLEKHNPDVLTLFSNYVEDAINRVIELTSLCPSGVNCQIFNKDSRDLPIEDETVDLIVTSPPYGEESHTMSYSRFSKLSLQFLGMTTSEISSYTRKSLGGKSIYGRPLTEDIDTILRQIAEVNEKRSKEVFSFIWDYGKCLGEMYRVLSPDSYLGVVIGDRTASGVKVSNGLITLQLAELVGFKHITTFQRDIPKKVLPRRDYKVELINKEHIIIMQKP